MTTLISKHTAELGGMSSQRVEIYMLIKRWFKNLVRKLLLVK